MTQTLPIASIQADGRTQARIQLQLFTIDEYADAMAAGAVFPPIDVFFDGETYILADGFHRLRAAVQTGREEIDAHVHPGGLDEAILFAVGSNDKHGLPRTNADKGHSVEMVLAQEKWQGWSNVKIAQLCKVSEFLVRRVRDDSTSIKSKCEPEERVYERNGRTQKMKTSKIGSASKISPGEFIDLDLRQQLHSTPTAEDPDEMRRLSKLPPEYHAPAVALLTEGRVERVRDARLLLEREERAQMPLPELPPAVVIERNDGTGHLPDGYADLILTDPPYNISDDAKLTKVGDRITSAVFSEEWDTQDPSDYLEGLYPWAEEWERLLRPGGSVVCFIDRKMESFLWDAMIEAALLVKSPITWVKRNVAPTGFARRNLLSATEALIWAVKPGAPWTFNEVPISPQCPAGWDRRNVIETNITPGPEKVDHPTQKPLSVLSPLIACFSDPGDMVLDMFAGSGSTGVAAVRLGRGCHLIERDPEHEKHCHLRLANEGRSERD